MAEDTLIQQMLALPDIAAQKRFLEDRPAILDERVAAALKKQADHYLRSDVRLSLQTAALLLDLGDKESKPIYRALGLLAEANARSVGGLGEFEQAIALYNEAAEIYRLNNRPMEQARSQTGKLYALANLGRYGEALQTGEWAARILEEHAEWCLLARLTLNMGLIYGRMGEDSKALAVFDRAEKLYRRAGVEGAPSLPWASHNRAIVLRNLGRFSESIQASQSAWEMLSQSGQTVEAARAKQNMALTNFVLGRYNEALDLLDQARDVFAADGRARDVVLVDLFTSDCLLQVRRYSDVLEKCSRIRDSLAQAGARFEAAQAILNEAVAYAGLDRYDEAMASLAEARRLFAEEGNPVWIACTDLEMAALLLRQGQCERSLAAAQACAEIFSGHSLPVREAQAHLVAARAAAALNRDELALRLVTSALAVAGRDDLPTLAYQGHQLLGSLAAAQGDQQTALAEYQRAIQELERLRGRLMVEYRADFLEDKQKVYEDIVCLCLDTDQPLQALDYVERAKSRALLDMLAYRLDLSLQARKPADDPLVEELTRLRSERDRLYRRWEGREEAREEDWATADASLHQVRQDLLAREKRITELWHTLLIHNADYARDAALWQVRTEPVQPYLPRQTVLVEYFIAHKQLIAFVVSPQAVQVWRLPGDLAGVQRTTEFLWLNLKAVPGSTPVQVAGLAANARGLLQRLHKLLIAPLGDVLAPYPRLVVVPHGPLHYVPFHALYDGQRFLLEQHEISYLPGASLLRYCRETLPAAGSVLALGHSSGGRLPYTAEETSAVARLLHGQVFLEEEATLERLRTAAPDCRTIHLAAHGEFRPDNPLFSGLELADGWLTTLDIFNLRLQASLVVLSGCQTGRSVVGGGDELLGLMRALLYAGARSVVLSLWTVEDRSTARLMETFYGKLAEGWSKGAALRHAQRQLIAGQGRSRRPLDAALAHPYFWAAFCLVGDAGLL